MTTDMTRAAGMASDAPIFDTKFGQRAKGSRILAMTAAVVTAGLTLSLATVALPGQPAKAAVPEASFGRATKLSLPLNSASVPSAFALSCSSFGNCVAGGAYLDRSGNTQALAITEKSGRWVRGVKLRLPKDAPHSVSARVTAVACTRVGDCTAVGD